MKKLLIVLLPILFLSAQFPARADGVSFGFPLPFPFLFYNFDQGYYAQPYYGGGYYHRPYCPPAYHRRAYYYGGYYRPYYRARHYYQPGWYGYGWPR